jgi:Ran GTPase-activating protein (RanGAP) involved in mRNA processing and transport
MSDSASLSPTFLSACAKLRANDPSVVPGRNLLPGLNGCFWIRHGLSETEHIEIANALTRSTAVTNLQLDLSTLDYSAKAAEAMGEFIRSSIHLKRVTLSFFRLSHTSEGQRVLSILLRALQDSTSVKELRLVDEAYLRVNSELVLSQDLTNLIILTRTLKKMNIGCHYEALWLCAAKNETLEDLTLNNYSRSRLTRMLKWLGNNCPNLKTLSIKLITDDLTGLDTLLESYNSNITELILSGEVLLGFNTFLDTYRLLPLGGLETALRPLEGRKNTLTKLEMRGFPLSLDQIRHLQMVLRNQKNLQILVLRKTSLESAHLSELASELEQHMSIKTLDLAENRFDDMDSAVILRNIIHTNKSIAALDLSRNSFGERPEAVRCIAMGLRRSATLLEISLRHCQLGNQGVSVLAETLFSRDGILQKLYLADSNIVSFTSVRLLVDAMIEHESQITHLHLKGLSIGDEGASYLANALAANALPHLTWLSVGGFGDDGLVNLVSALETNQALNELDLTSNHMDIIHYSGHFSERGFLALANSLPEIRQLKRIHFQFCPGLISAMPSLLEGLRANTSVIQFDIARSFLTSMDDPHFPLTDLDTSKYSGDWMIQMQFFGFRNRFISMIRPPFETAPPLGLWAPALAKVSKMPDVLFYVLRSKAASVSSGIA